jgi:hypothetical protein
MPPCLRAGSRAADAVRPATHTISSEACALLARPRGLRPTPQTDRSLDASGRRGCAELSRGTHRTTCTCHMATAREIAIGLSVRRERAAASLCGPSLQHRERRWRSRARDRGERRRRDAEDLHRAWRSDDRCDDGQRWRAWLTGAAGQVLAEGAIVGVDVRAFRPSMRLDVRRRLRTDGLRLKLRVSDRSHRRSGQLDQRDDERQQPQTEWTDRHRRDGN